LQKRISIVIPCYNEVENIAPLAEAIMAEMETSLSEYDYEICFSDNDSTDGTRDAIEKLCAEHKQIKAIFNATNFGFVRSQYHAMCQMHSDCVIMMCADFQDPVELLPVLVREWENGYAIVSCIKTQSEENKLMYLLRSFYYKLIRKMSDVEQIEHFTGFGLYDQKFIQVLRQLDDPMPWLRGIVAELGFRRKNLPYKQAERRAGKSHFNFFRMYDLAMVSFTSYTKAGLRLATFAGAGLGVLCLLIAMFYFVMKLLYWDSFPAGIAAAITGIFFMGAMQLFFLGLLGEYVISINTRVMHRPLVVEERRINFDTPAPQQGASRPHA